VEAQFVNPREEQAAMTNNMHDEADAGSQEMNSKIEQVLNLVKVHSSFEPLVESLNLGLLGCQC
jgi:hypothetical protein